MPDHDNLSPFTAETLLGALHACAAAWPRTPLAFPELGETITVVQLRDAADELGRALVRAGVRRPDLVGLLSGTGPQVLTGIIGATAAGAAVSVLPNPPVLGVLEPTARRIARMVAAGGMRFLLVDQAHHELAELIAAACPGVTVLRLPRPDAIARGPGAGAVLPEVGRDDIAVVQFTSGSTARPKGVVLRHGTVLSALRSIAISERIRPDDVFIQWLPHFHDMGLFGALVHVLCGVPTHHFSPMGFVRRPAAFLRYFAEQGGTITSGPNFGYELMLDTADEVAAGLDLSRWRLAFNGSEPVAAATVSAFARRLSPAGVRPEVMYPVYGMAEATLAVTFPEQGHAARILHVDRQLVRGTAPRLADPADPQARPLVSVGRPIDGMSLLITDERGWPVPGPELGEIRISGPAVTEGYWQDPVATAAAVDGAWLRTGDLGFRHEGELYVVGRIKEMIIVNGTNYFAEDVEAVVRETPGVFRGRCVAVPADAEYLTVAAESRAADDALAERIQARIAAELGLSAVRIRLVRPGALPRTTSGKIQRVLARTLVEETS